MIENLTLRNLSPATQRSYVQAGGEVQPVFGRSPETLTPEDVRTYQVQLASEATAWASLNRTGAALRFFDGATLGMAFIPERIACASEPRRPAVGLSADRGTRFLDAGPADG